MKASSSEHYKKQKLQQRGCKALCCSCRLSVSSSEEAESSNSDQFASISSLAHAMVQERLDQMIRERQEARHRERRKQRVDDHDHQGTKFIIMVAMEKCSYDPREDFRESMIEVIMANRIEETKDLRSLLNYYLSMNSTEHHGIILEVFYEPGVAAKYCSSLVFPTPKRASPTRCGFPKNVTAWSSSSVFRTPENLNRVFVSYNVVGGGQWRPVWHRKIS